MLKQLRGDLEYLQMYRSIITGKNVTTIIEYVNGLTIHDFGETIRRNRVLLREYEKNRVTAILAIYRSLFRIISQLHSKHHIAHRDLNLNNIVILLDGEGKFVLDDRGDPKIKLLDFGSACNISPSDIPYGLEASTTELQSYSPMGESSPVSKIVETSDEATNASSPIAGATFYRSHGVTPLYYSRALCERTNICFHDYWCIIILIYYLYNLKYPDTKEQSVCEYIDNFCHDPVGQTQHLLVKENRTLYEIQNAIINYNLPSGHLGGQLRP